LTRAAWLLGFFLLAGCSASTEHMRSDWELENAEKLAREGDLAAAVALPPYPAASRLIEFAVQRLPDYRFYVDAGSLSAKDDIIRYALVSRSSAGAETVSYEGLNCRAAEYRLYASGRAGGWVPQRLPWRETGARSPQRVLMVDFFCPRRAAIESAEEGIMALRRGAHPNALSHEQSIPGGAR
jgi:hypothetical protein